MASGDSDKPGVETIVKIMKTLNGFIPKVILDPSPSKEREEKYGRHLLQISQSLHTITNKNTGLIKFAVDSNENTQPNAPGSSPNTKEHEAKLATNAFPEWIVKYILKVASLNHVICEERTNPKWMLKDVCSKTGHFLRSVCKNNNEAFHAIFNGLTELLLMLINYSHDRSLSQGKSLVDDEGTLQVRGLDQYGKKLPNSLSKDFPRIQLTFSSEGSRVNTIDLILNLLCSTRSPDCEFPSEHELQKLLQFNDRSTCHILNKKTADYFVAATRPDMWSQEKLEHFFTNRFQFMMEMSSGDPLVVPPTFQRQFTFMYGLHSGKNLKKHVILNICKTSWRASGLIRDFIIHHVDGLAMMNRSTIMNLFNPHAEFIIESMLNQLQNEDVGDSTAGQFFMNAMSIFNSTSGSAMDIHLKYVLINMCLHPENTNIVKDIFLIDNKDIPNVVQNYFSDVVTHLIVQYNDLDILISSIKRLAIVSEVPLHELLIKARFLVRDLFLLYHSHPKLVVEMVRRHASISSFRIDPYNHEADLRTYIINNEYINQMLLSLQCMSRIVGSQEGIREGFQSLKDIMQLVGQHGLLMGRTHNMVSAFLHEMCTRALVNEYTNEQFLLIVQVYDTFVRNLPVDVLKNHLQKLVKDLMMIYPYCQDIVGNILSYMIVDHQHELSHPISRLAFILKICPQTEHLTQVFQVIQSKMTQHQEDVFEPVEQLLILSKEALAETECDLKYFTIGKVINWIQQYYNELMKPENFQRWGHIVVGNLLTDSKKQTYNVKLIIAKALGEIGAIDLGRFEEEPAGGDAAQRCNQLFPRTVSHPDFLKILIEKLYEMSGAYEMSKQHCVLYTLQEVNKVMEPEKKAALMAVLPEDITSLIKSLENTQYNVNMASVWKEVDRLHEEDVIFHSKMIYSDWIRLWVKRIIRKLDIYQHCTKVLLSLTPLFTHNVALAESLLPTVVATVYSDYTVTNDVLKSVVINEINAVIHSAIPESSSISTYENSSPVEAQVSVTTCHLNEVEQLCSQQIFILIDTLKHWVIKSPADETRLRDDLKLVSKLQLAHLAYGCQAYARSFQYIEEYIKEEKNDQIDPYLNLIQKNFIAMNDPDGVEGVNRIQKWEPTLMEQIHTHEANNRLQDALSCCSMGKEETPDSLDYTKFQLRCLLSIQETTTALELSEGIIRKRPNWRSRIAPYMVEAAWKLSKWDELTKILNEHPADKDSLNFNYAIGSLLSCVKNNDTTPFKDILDAQRLKLMNPIGVTISEKAAYSRCYQQINRLHRLTELERSAQVLCQFPQSQKCKMDKHQLNDWMKLRNSFIPVSLQSLEPVMSLQRVLFSLGQSGAEIDMETFAVPITESWLVSAKISRKSGNLQKAYQCLMQVNRFLKNKHVNEKFPLLSGIIKENSKFLLAKGQKEDSVQYLSKSITKYFSKCVQDPSMGPRAKDPTIGSAILSHRSSVNGSQKSAYIPLVLLHTKLNEEVGGSDTQMLIDRYQAANTFCGTEKGFFQLAKHHDKMYDSATQNDIKVKQGTLAITNYLESLTYGSKYARETMPRIFHIFCEIGSISQALEDRRKGMKGTRHGRAAHQLTPIEASVRSSFDATFAEMKRMKNSVPSYLLYLVFSQMLSRILHPNDKVSGIMKELLTEVMKNHLKQCMWLILPSLRSCNPHLRSACDIILNEIGNRSCLNRATDQTDRKQLATKIENDQRYIKDLKGFADKAFEFANLKGVKSGVTTLESFSRHPKAFPFVKMTSDISKYEILVPFRRFLTISGPVMNENQFSPFEMGVTIHKVEKELVIFQSQAKPRKITLVGSDGVRYPLLIKGDEDDVRLDARFMDCLDLMNRLLQKDPETRKRNLKCKLYSVIALGEGGGIMEFVPGMTSIKSIILEAYLSPEYGMSKSKMNTIKAKMEAKTGDHGLPHFKKLEIFQECVTDLSPPALGLWFSQKFRNADEWINARYRFTRSWATWCIIGYIVGLGDRHLENVLINAKTGEIFHVDLNLLFNKGDFLQVPEIIPFRLTHNIVAAMGPLGYEGPFRRTCEEVLRVMRKQKDSILSILKPFILDPSSGYEASGKVCKKNPIPVVANDLDKLVDIKEYEAVDPKINAVIVQIEKRLNGICLTRRECIEAIKNKERLDDDHRLPLSVSGQVKNLIEEATDEKNLCELFPGWAPYM